MPAQTIREFVRENTIQVEGSDQLLRIRVLDPVFLFYGKIRNAVDIEQDQPDKPRQDVKHVAMLSLCVPRFLEGAQNRIGEDTTRTDTLENYIRMLAAVKSSYSGRQFAAQHPSVIRWQDMIPPVVQEMTFDRELQASLRQLISL